MWSRIRIRPSSPETLRAQLAHHVARADQATGPLAEARALQRARRVAQRLSLAPQEAELSYRLGLRYRAAGKVAKAEAALARAAMLWGDLGNREACGDTALAQAGVALMNQRLSAARAHADTARAFYVQAGCLAARPQLGRLLHAIDVMARTHRG